MTRSWAQVVISCNRGYIGGVSSAPSRVLAHLDVMKAVLLVPGLFAEVLCQRQTGISVQTSGPDRSRPRIGMRPKSVDNPSTTRRQPVDFRRLLTLLGDLAGAVRCGWGHRFLRSDPVLSHS